ncbi:MAG: EF-hand domain-containing protein [Verrucomicrobiaceae bacterium]|nr:EF-hand domain-containing protein [Verrucomicrobiaceae bacterium]
MRTFCNAPRLTLVIQNESPLIMHTYLFLCLLILPVTGLAQERTFGTGTLSEFLSLYDVDDSGGLSPEELKALSADRKNSKKNGNNGNSSKNRVARVKNRWDTDGDGKISHSEREAAKSAIRNQIEARRALRFDEVDNNSDGFLTLAEFNSISAVGEVDEARPGVSEELYYNLDLDDDGKVSKQEFLRKIDSLPVFDPAKIPKTHPRLNDMPPAPAR